MRARDNPFRVERLHRLGYRFPGFDWGGLLSRLERQGGRGAIRGACGTGKSTLLRQLARRLVDADLRVHHRRLHPEGGRVARRQAHELGRLARSGAALLVDGADRLGPLAWRRFERSARAATVFVVTTHREGRLPTLHRCAEDPRVLCQLVAELEPDHELSHVEARRLLHACDGDVRDVLRLLYDRAAAASR